jgi:hypothetical protein
VKSTARVVAACILVALGARAPRAADEVATPTEPLTEKVTVHLVQIPFLATDRNGNPITDLKPEEIVVRTARSPQDPTSSRPRRARSGTPPDARACSRRAGAGRSRARPVPGAW